MRIIYEEVSTTRIKRWTCPQGKRRQKKKTFFQTINPYNKNKDGSVKTRAEIRREITAQADAWLDEPGYVCSRCNKACDVFKRDNGSHRTGCCYAAIMT